MKDILLPIIISLIPTIPALIASIQTSKSRREGKMFDAKQSILQMQMEDVMSVEILHKLPTNHARIHYEYDKYKENGGNSDIDEKMSEYEEWYSTIEEKIKCFQN